MAGSISWAATVLVLAFASLILRRRAPVGIVRPPVLVLSAVTAGLLVVTGWYGSELPCRHMIEVTEHGYERGTTDSETGGAGRREASGEGRAGPDSSGRAHWAGITSGTPGRPSTKGRPMERR